VRCHADALGTPVALSRGQEASMSDHILVGIDFDRTYRRTFETAMSFAQALNAELDLVHVASPIPVEAGATGAAELVREADAKLRELAAIAGQRGLTVHTHVVTETPAFGLLAAITELDPQLVIVGSHGRSGVTRVLLGSVSETLARRSPTPVLIVPSPERRQHAAAAAWACADCGHILAGGEQRGSCSRCGRTGGSWISAPIASGPVDAREPTVGEAVACDLVSTQTQSGSGLFATSAPGGRAVDVNPELRVRY
jgi:universal stress protein A